MENLRNNRMKQENGFKRLNGKIFVKTKGDSGKNRTMQRDTEL